MESPNKKKLRSGVSSTVGGKLGGSTYKTASPYNIKTMNMTNGLSPLIQAAVGGEPVTISGQNIIKTKEGYIYDSGQEKIPVQDPDNILEFDEEGGIIDYDYQVEESKDGLVIKGAETAKSGGEGVPEMPPEPGGMPGGVGGPMEMHSPNKIYEDGKRRKNYTY